MSLDHSTARDGSVPDRIIGEPECKELTDLSRSTRWRLMRKGDFPAKVALSPNRKGWRLSAIVGWLEAREAT